MMIYWAIYIQTQHIPFIWHHLLKFKGPRRIWLLDWPTQFGRTLRAAGYKVGPKTSYTHLANGPWKKKFELYFPY